jgi:hypothetical protein
MVRKDKIINYGNYNNGLTIRHQSNYQRVEPIQRRYYTKISRAL